MASKTWSSAKAKVQLRLSVQRLRTLQQKKEAQAKSTRRDIAILLERGKIESARVKVEATKGYGVKWASPTTLVETPKSESSSAPLTGTPAVTDVSSEQLPAYSEQKSKDEAPKLPDIPPTEGENEKRTQSTPSIRKETAEDDFEALTRRFQDLKKR
ncbi:hypothetical protein ID866_5820 [Astraeus odoratus]|nr:hypothetical protein ID866_5820 [Astraeus odoratus]